MDVLSLEHYFGKEIETSLRQLFNYFCNHINLGQWMAAKACLKQLDLNKKNFDFDYNSILIDIVKNPEIYSHGSCILESPYHLSLLLYDFCTQNGYIETPKDESFYDKIVFKFIIYSSMLNNNGTNSESNKESTTSTPNTKNQAIVDELVDIMWPQVSNKNVAKPTLDRDILELSTFTFEFVKHLFITQSPKAKSLIQLVIKYNKSSQYVFLKAHLSAIYALLDDFDEKRQTSARIYTLVNYLCAYELNEKNPSSNYFYESLALVQRCFKDLCYKFNAFWSHNLEELDEHFAQLYSSLLFEYDELVNKETNSNEANLPTINMIYLFSKIHYEVDKQITIAETFNDDSLIVLSLIKQYSHLNTTRKDLLWRRLFLYCYVENKLLLKTIIDECLLLISRAHYDQLNLIFSVKEFLNLKPLILLLGISKVNDVQSAKKLLAAICLNHEKGTLIEKIGNILKTHLDFITWFQQVKFESHKKVITFAELIKLLHRQLPLNIISQHLDVTQVEYAEVTKMLKNTLMDKENDSKTKWVRFVDEVNEKISQIQEVCLSIYNGFYCLNEVLNTILYCCENLNSKIYSNLTAAAKYSVFNKSNLNLTESQHDFKQSHHKQTSLERIQLDYNTHVLEKLEIVKKIVNQIIPAQYRIEIIENIYSLIFVTSHDLKESEDEEEEENGENNSEKDGMNLTPENETEINEQENTTTKDSSEGFEILSDDVVNSNLLRQKSSDDHREYSIYDLGQSSKQHGNSNINQMTNHSSKSTLGSFCSNTSHDSHLHRKYSSGHLGHGVGTTNEDDNLDGDFIMNRKSKTNIYRRNAGGGGSFLVNDFMCRDLLLLLKETLQNLLSLVKTQSDSSFKSPNVLDDALTSSELNTKILKLQQLVSETLWRFQIVKCDLVSIEYGRITNLMFSHDMPALVNDRQQNLVYELMKKKKRRDSSTSTHPFVESLNYSQNKNQSKLPEQSQPLTLVLNKARALTTVETVTTSIGGKDKRRSLESHRSLSIIYPHNKYKRSNQTVMKLISNIQTLSVLCLKEHKFSEANQLVKMYSPPKSTTPTDQTLALQSHPSSSFEFGQILFHSAYEQCLSELVRINRRKEQNTNNDDVQGDAEVSELAEESLLSLDIAKATQPLIELKNETDLVQSIILCDLVVTSNLNLSLSLGLVEYSRAKLNKIASQQNENVSDLKDSSASSKDAELSKFNADMRTKLGQFTESAQSICRHFDVKQTNKTLTEYLFGIEGVYLSLSENSRNKLCKSIESAIEKFESYTQFKQNLNDTKLNFESALTNAQQNQHRQQQENTSESSLIENNTPPKKLENEVYFDIMTLLNNSIRLSEQDDLISSFFYKPLVKYDHSSVSQEVDRFSTTSLKTAAETTSLSISLNSLNLKSSSNYLLSFYEYCKTLYEYFREKSTTTVTSTGSSCFSILEYSPASLICKLLFEDAIKPLLIESLTQKLNLNLTAIILHNSCPRLKLTLAPNFKNHRLLIPQISHSNSAQSISYTKQSSTTTVTEQQKLAYIFPPPATYSTSSDSQIYNLSSFYLILNQSDIMCCSRKKPDEFLRDLLLKVLKYCKSFLTTPSTESTNNLIGQPRDTRANQFVDMKVAKDIYQCAEFKTILNESQELQHLNLYFLKTDAQKLSFFINLYNLLCIHSHFFLASVNSSKWFESTQMGGAKKLDSLNVAQALILNQSDNQIGHYLFRNKTEELLFRQNVCYKVGQMGCVSLYDLKHHILSRRCLNNDNLSASMSSSSKTTSSSKLVTSTSLPTTTKSAKSLLNRISLAKSSPKQPVGSPKPQLMDFNKPEHLANHDTKLYKNAYFALDLESEPLWSPFLPSESVLDYRILFALTNCTESDPPICVFNADNLLFDQLAMQMKLFLSDSIYADLCDDVLYLPGFLLENCSLFIDPSSSKSYNVSGGSNSVSLPGSKSDLDSLVRFLIDHVNAEVKEGLKCLLDLDSIDDFGENIDEFGRKELPFPVTKIADSGKFSLIIDYNYSNESIHGLLKNNAADGNASGFGCLWYRREICRVMSLCEQKKLKARKSVTLETNPKESTSNEDSNVHSESDERSNDDSDETRDESKILEESKSQLNKDCLDYIHKNSSLISNSLSFLFDVNKREAFFKSLSENGISGDEGGGGGGVDSMMSTKQSSSLEVQNSLYRFIQLYVPLDYMKHLSMQTKLNLITQFLLTNKTEESKIELIIDLANYYAQKQEWNVVLDLLNNCTQDNEELNDLMRVEMSAAYSNMTASMNNGENNLNELEFNRNHGMSKNLGINDISNSRLSQKDLYNLFDHACICNANQESKTNEKSYTHLFKMKNFLRQIRAIFGLMHLWSIDGCLEMIDYCLTKSRLFEYPSNNINRHQPSTTTASSGLTKHISLINMQTSTISTTSSSNSLSNLDLNRLTTDYFEQMSECHRNLMIILSNKKVEFTAYKELTRCARLTLEKYYEHQQIQDAAGFYDKNENQGFSSTNVIDKNFNLTNMNKMKKVCQKCLTWQFAKNQLESSSNSDDEETNELIMDLFLLNDQFTSAKYLIKKLNLSSKLQFKLDMGHLKYRLLNLNVASSIIVIDLDAVLKECIAFANENGGAVSTSSTIAESHNNDNHFPTKSSYVFEICFKLLNEFKDLNELNNQVLISLSEFLINNYKHLLTMSQLKELKILQLTAKIFQILVQEDSIQFDAYKRHHSQPLLIIEQLLMNSHIDLCSRTIKLCRDNLNEPEFLAQINETLVTYASKALEFKAYSKKLSGDQTLKRVPTGTSVLSDSGYDTTAKRFSLAIPSGGSLTKSVVSKGRKQSHPIEPIPININNSVSPNINIIASSSPSSFSSSFKNFYKFGMPSSNTTNQTFSTNGPSISPNSLGIYNASNVNNTSMSSSFGSSGNFIMPPQVPSKEEWVKDEDVNECMVCNTTKFTILNRRHHCRRCGRVVCSNCSQKVTIIENMQRRTCDDCYKQIETTKLSENARILDTLNESLDEGASFFATNLRRKSKLSVLKATNNFNDASTNLANMDESAENTSWQLMGGSIDNESSLKRDDEIRLSFRYQQSPSTSLCLSILDLHDNPLECGKHLLSMCDDLSSHLQTANSQVEDVGLIINMCNHLLHNAKVKLLQNSSTSNIISLCDSYLSLVDVVEQLLMANCSQIPSLNELRNTESARRVRNRLLEEERHELAMNVSTKCGLDSQTVWASWGLIELRRGRYKEARTKFEKCLKQQVDRSASIGATQLKILNDVIGCLENSPPIRMLGPQTLLAPLRSVETLIAEPTLYSVGESNLDDIQLKESIYYLETYGNYNLIVAFYQRHGYMENAFQYLIEKKCSSDVFVESLLVPGLRNGEFYHLLEYMLSMERSQNKLYLYYASIGKYLEKNSYLNTLYDFQLLMKDYVRACMSCICFFSRHCTNYAELFANLHYLNKASKHLEQYLEISTIKQFAQNSQQQQLTWKQKPEQQNLCKQMSTQEVDNYLKAINLQIEVTKFINNCMPFKRDQINSQKTPTLFGSNDTKINLCCLILLSGQSIQEGFGFVIRIKQCFNLNPTLVYSQIARELAKQYNFKEINNLLKCINESGYKDEINASYDECISTCIRVFAAAGNGSSTSNNSSTSASNSSTSNTNNTTQTNIYASQQQLVQYNKEIEDLIQLIKDDENKINAYILNGRLKSAYLIAIKIDRPDVVKHISNVAERMGQNLIKDICIKWLEKKLQSK